MNRNIALILVAIALIGGLAYYRENLVGYFDRRDSAAVTRELKETVTYDAPNGKDVVTFSVFVDGNGVITDAKAVNQADPANAQLFKFAEGLRTVIVGKKFAELGPVDKIGTSSLTTAAFNSALAKLKAQL